MTLKSERWISAAVALAAGQLVLYLFIHVFPGSLAVQLWGIGPKILLIASIIVFMNGVIATVLNRKIPVFKQWAAFFLLVAVSIFSLTGYKVYPSSHHGEISPVKFRLPLDEPLTVIAGGDSYDVNHHIQYPNQRWGYDFTIVKEGKTFRGNGSSLSDYYIYSKPVLASAAGRVVAMTEDEPDMEIGVWSQERNYGGNSVMIEVAPNQFLFIGHLAPHSIAVKVGDVVRAGQIIGRVGNSGRTIEPHIHIHLQDSPDQYRGEGIPLYFYHYILNGEPVERGMPTGGMKNVVENIH